MNKLYINCCCQIMKVSLPSYQSCYMQIVLCEDVPTPGQFLLMHARLQEALCHSIKVHFKALIRLELAMFQVVLNPDPPWSVEGGSEYIQDYRGEVMLSDMCMFIKYRLIQSFESTSGQLASREAHKVCPQSAQASELYLTVSRYNVGQRDLSSPTDLPGRIFKVDSFKLNSVQFFSDLTTYSIQAFFYHVSQHFCGILQNLSGTQVLVCMKGSDMSESNNGSPVGVEVVGLEVLELLMSSHGLCFQGQVP